MIKRLLTLLPALALPCIVAAGAALALSKLEPVAWQAGPNPGLTGVFERNNDLATAERWLSGIGTGPEDIAFGADGYFYTGVADGRILRFDDDGNWDEYADTGGRPLGMEFDNQGRLIVADAVRGLLAVDNDGSVAVLADAFDGSPLKFVDDLTIAGDGRIYVSDASQRFGYTQSILIFLEGRAAGRVLRFDPASGELAVVLDGLFFANGVALGPDETYLLVAETAAGRIARLWLKGPRAGERDVFSEGLPGAPDNLSFNGRDTVWVALAGLRSPEADALADRPLLRQVLGALPVRYLQPVSGMGMVVGLDLEGAPVISVQAWDRVFRKTTSVYEHDDSLFIGSVEMDSIAVLPLPASRL